MDVLGIDVIPRIAAKMGVDGLWRDINDVVADYCSIAMASDRFRPLLNALAEVIWRQTGLVRKRPEGIEVTVSEKSTLPEIKGALRRLGMPVSGNKAYLLASLRQARQHREAELKVALNPIPPENRKKFTAVRRIVSGTAKSDYHLNDDDLARLPVALVLNPYGRNQPPMRLYKVRDVRAVALAKHGGLEGFERMVQKSEMRKSLLRAGKQEKIDIRRRTLTEALSRYGCELRGDSRLCNAYIQRGAGDPDRIAEVMAEMRFFHERTRYRDILDENLRAYREWGEHYDYDEESEAAKVQAMREYDGDMRHVPRTLGGGPAFIGGPAFPHAP